MLKYKIEVDGMMCGMCEAHANDAIRRAFPEVKKIKSNHSKGYTAFVAEEGLDEAKIRAAFDGTGYTLGKLTTEPWKGGLFAKL